MINKKRNVSRAGGVRRNQGDRPESRPVRPWGAHGESLNAGPTRRDGDGSAPFEAESVFAALPLPIQRAVRDEGYTKPTPIQAQAIPHLLEGRDLFGCAQTGTGKTAAYVLPLLSFLDRNRHTPSPGRPRALILAPTRELAAQIGDSIGAYGRYLSVTRTVIFGGVGQTPQVKSLREGTDIVVATPGRLLDLMGQRHIFLDGIEVFVLDEADRMLDMGFIPDIRRIVAKLPRERQSLFFSATIPKEVVELADDMVRDPVHVTVSPGQPEVGRIVQKVLFVEKKDKNLLLTSLLKDQSIYKALVFTEMKHVANRVTRDLHRAGISAVAIHGNKSQNARTQAMAGFKGGRTRVLVATDIAARGIDVDDITHVINFDLPREAETYVHRIGCTARASADGDALSFCCSQERSCLSAIERLIRKRIPVDLEHPFHSEKARCSTGAASFPSRGRVQGRRGKRAGSYRGGRR